MFLKRLLNHVIFFGILFVISFVLSTIITIIFAEDIPITTVIGNIILVSIIISIGLYMTAMIIIDNDR